MAGKGILTKTECGTWLFRLVLDGKVIDRIEVDAVLIATEDEIAKDEDAAAKDVWDKL
jgi:hypothetical protein